MAEGVHQDSQAGTLHFTSSWPSLMFTCKIRDHARRLAQDYRDAATQLPKAKSAFEVGTKRRSHLILSGTGAAADSAEGGGGVRSREQYVGRHICNDREGKNCKLCAFLV
jgi:hypothetical protein